MLEKKLIWLLAKDREYIKFLTKLEDILKKYDDNDFIDLLIVSVFDMHVMPLQ